MKTTTIVSVVAGLVFGSFASVVSAAGLPTLSVTPGGLTKTAGEVFTPSVVLAGNGTFIYAVEGTLTFDNASCRGISVASGLMIQSMPTCANPYFLVGIPNGTPNAKTLLTVSVSGKAEGVAGVGLTGVDVIGKGESLAREVSGASYTIKGALVTGTEGLDTTPGTVVGEPGEVSEEIPGEIATTTEGVTASSTVEATATSTENNLGAVVTRAITNLSAFMIVLISMLAGVVIAGIVYYRRNNRREVFEDIPTDLQ